MKRKIALIAIALIAWGAYVVTPSVAFQPGPRLAGPKTASGTVEFAFTPGDRADRIIIEAIARARREVLVQAFSFTHRDIARALVQAHQRGVRVAVIADAEQTQRFSRTVVDLLAGAGVLVLLDSAHEAAHSKVMIIDAATPDCSVVTGSYNFTNAAQHRNAENLVVFRGNRDACDSFAQDWHRHAPHSLEYRRDPDSKALR